MSKSTEALELHKSLLQRMTDFEAKLSTLPRTQGLENLSQEFTVFRDYVHDIFSIQQQQISSLSIQLDNIEMYHRRKHLILNGVTERPDEDVPAVVSDVLCKSLHTDSIPLSSISSAHRLGVSSQDKIRPVLIRFSTLALRNEVWRRKAQLKGTPLVLSEFLTKQRKALFLEGRRHFGMRNVWTIGGVIYIKLSNGSRQKVACQADLDELISKFPTNKEDPTASTSKQTDRNQQSRPKRAARHK